MNSYAANYLSFMLTDTIMWLGLRDMINSFRTETLGLTPIHILSAAATVHKLKIPFTYCWYVRFNNVAFVAKSLIEKVTFVDTKAS